ncbi:NAD(P)-dependent oxidoreductase [Adhaeribacter radiodurans]|uniref:SDR family oxidoreductase n=1 Tax=Adhaeribacter radiodurans TaxID=2745197 RepID=A0A7L7L373_9BACT|nr:SDR family oxidoreductase [Adhaeribacter radiodurans]QMU27252.1 SDR family oxidoreductase [Adhaeribacter radiodurans]
MKSKIKIAVLGGTGKAGKYLVNQLLAQGIPFKALVRNPEKFNIVNPLIEVVPGDVQDYESIYTLVAGCQAVISTLGLGQPPSEPTLFSQATTHLLRAMQAHQIKRYILITGLNVNTPFDKKGTKTQYATDWMYTHYPKSTQDKQLEYTILSASNLNWTLVRLPLIEQTDERREIKVSMEDCPGDKISATDLACFLIEQLNSDTYLRQAPFIANS